MDNEINEVSINDLVSNFSEKENLENNEELIRFGESFNSEIHAVDSEGKPKITAKGRFAKKRGLGSAKAKMNKIPESTLEEKKEPEFINENSENIEKDKVKFEEPVENKEGVFLEPEFESGNQKMALMLVNAFQLANANFLGEEFIFRNFDVDGTVFSESEECTKSVLAVLDHYQLEGEIHPLLGLGGFACMFYGSRLKEEKPRKKLFAILEKVKISFSAMILKFRSWRTKKAVKIDE